MAHGGGRFLTRDLSEPEPALNERRMQWVHGRVLGGGSSVNGMIYTRGHTSDYDGWQCTGWSFRDVLPYFLRSECSERGSSVWHGTTGPVAVARGRSPLPLCDSFLEAAASAGHTVVDDLNADVSEGFGHFDHTIDNGVRSSAARAFLRRRRSNLIIRTRTIALHIVFEGRRAIGVATLCDRKSDVLQAAREVIVCAGALELTAPSDGLRSRARGPSARLSRADYPRRP